jgi:hypothetical protein
MRGTPRQNSSRLATRRTWAATNAEFTRMMMAVGCPILPCGLHPSAKRHAAFAATAVSPHSPNAARRNARAAFQSLFPGFSKVCRHCDLTKVARGSIATAL